MNNFQESGFVFDSFYYSQSLLNSFGEIFTVSSNNTHNFFSYRAVLSNCKFNRLLCHLLHDMLSYLSSSISTAIATATVAVPTITIARMAIAISVTVIGPITVAISISSLMMMSSYTPPASNGFGFAD